MFLSKCYTTLNDLSICLKRIFSQSDPSVPLPLNLGITEFWPKIVPTHIYFNSSLNCANWLNYRDFGQYRAGLRRKTRIHYRVFCLDSTSFILQAEQHKMDSCSMVCLSKILQGLCCRHLKFLFSKNLE